MNGLPDIDARRDGDGITELDFVVSAACLWFDGHFPGRPILPGVVQVGWAAHFARAFGGHEEPPTRLERIKFKRPVEPGARLTLRLRKAGGKVQYEYLAWHGAERITASSGVLAYGDGA